MHKCNFLLKIFPPPKFLEMPVVGVDVSDKSIKFAELTTCYEGTRLGRFGEKIIPEGVIESGLIQKPEELEKILTEIKKETNFEHVNISLPEERAYLVSIKLPKMAKKNIRGSIELQLEEHVPLPASEMIFDYELVSSAGDSSGYVCVVSVLPRGVVNSYKKVFSNAGFTPVAFEVETQAVARSIIPSGDKGTYMMVDIGRTRTGFTISSGGVVWFSSTVNLGGDAIVSAIKSKMNLSEEEAKHTKEDKGMSREADNRDLFNLITSVASVLRDELNKHYLYWNTHVNETGIKRKKIEEIFICGGDANIPGVIEYLSSGIDVPVSLGNPWSNVVSSFDNYIPEMPHNDSLRFATAIGLAMRRFI